MLDLETRPHEQALPVATRCGRQNFGVRAYSDKSTDRCVGQVLPGLELQSLLSATSINLWLEEMFKAAATSDLKIPHLNLGNPRTLNCSFMPRWGDAASKKSPSHKVARCSCHHGIAQQHVRRLDSRPHQSPRGSKYSTTAELGPNNHTIHVNTMCFKRRSILALDLDLSGYSGRCMEVARKLQGSCLA